MKKIKHRRLEASERPVRIPTTRVTIDKRTKAKRRSAIKAESRKAFMEL